MYTQCTGYLSSYLKCMARSAELSEVTVPFRKPQHSCVFRYGL
jgi:hypothetical protein